MSEDSEYKYAERMRRMAMADTPITYKELERRLSGACRTGVLAVPPISHGEGIDSAAVGRTESQFTCPRCGSHFFSTYDKGAVAVLQRINDGMSAGAVRSDLVGLCHGHSDGVPCRFEWKRTPSEDRKYFTEVPCENYPETTKKEATKSETSPKSIDDAIEKILSFRNLAEDWDSYGAKPIRLEAILTAALVVRRASCPTPYCVSPLPAGGVQVEWRNGTETLELTVQHGGDIDVLIDHGGLTVLRFSERFHVESEEAVRMVQEFVGKSTDKG